MRVTARRYPHQTLKKDLAPYLTSVGRATITPS